MGRLVVAVMAAVWVLAGWRNLPPLAHGQAAAAAVVIASCIAGAYWVGVSRQRSGNLAVAVASAEATAMASVTSSTESRSSAAVNVFVASPQSAAQARMARSGLMDDAPWMVGAHRRFEVEEGDDCLESAMLDVQHEAEYDARS